MFGAGRLGLGLTGDGGFGASAVSTPGEDAAVALPDPVTSHTEPSQSLFDRGTFGVGANETKYPYISGESPPRLHFDICGAVLLLLSLLFLLLIALSSAPALLPLGPFLQSSAFKLDTIIYHVRR